MTLVKHSESQAEQAGNVQVLYQLSPPPRGGRSGWVGVQLHSKKGAATGCSTQQKVPKRAGSGKPPEEFIGEALQRGGWD